MPKYHFPTKEERAKLIQEMQTLAAQQPQANQLFQDYANAVAALDKYMSELSLPAADGLPPALTKESTEELQRLISEAAKAGELFLRPQEPEPGHHRKQVQPAPFHDGGRRPRQASSPSSRQ